MSAAIEIDGITVTLGHQSMWLSDAAAAARAGDYEQAFRLALHEINELSRAIEELESRLPDEE